MTPSPIHAQATLLQQQHLLEERIHSALRSRAYSFNDPYICPNPYGIAPLTALVAFRTQHETAIHIRVGGHASAPDICYTSPKGRDHLCPIYGLLPAWNNAVYLEDDAHNTQILHIPTSPVPSLLKLPNVHLPSASSDDLIFTTPLMGSSLPAAFDRLGHVRWYLTESLAYQCALTARGTFLSYGTRMLCPPYSPMPLLELSILGKVLTEYRIPGGAYGECHEMEDGNILVLNQEFQRGTTRDLCVLVQRESGKVLRRWDLRDLLPMGAAASSSQIADDWLHANSVSYDKQHDAIIISCKHQDSIIALSFSSGELLWIAGDPTNWPDSYVQNAFLRPANPQQAWHYEQHSCKVLPDSSLLLFDNGHTRAKKGGAGLAPQQAYSRAVRYSVDYQARTISTVWEYGKEKGTAFYAPYLGSITVNPRTKAFLVNAGGMGFYANAPAEPPVYFLDGDEDKKRYQSSIIEVDGQQELFAMTLPVNCYHAACVPCEGISAHVPLEPGRVLGQWLETEAFELEMEWEDGGPLDSKYQLHISRVGDQLFIEAQFYQGEMVILSLSGPSEHLFYMQTTKNPYLTHSKQWFKPGPERPLCYPVTLAPLEPGTYRIFICIDSMKHDTGFSLSL